MCQKNDTKHSNKREIYDTTSILNKEPLMSVIKAKANSYLFRWCAFLLLFGWTQNEMIHIFFSWKENEDINVKHGISAAIKWFKEI